MQEAKGDYLVSKISITQIKMLVEFGVLPTILARSKFILIKRPDILGQAISLDIAWQNQQWVSSARPKLPDNRLIFSADRVNAMIHDIIHQNALFDHFFAANNLLPFALNYEQFVQQPAFWLNAISFWLEFVPPMLYEPSAISVRQQTRGINRIWRQKFLVEFHGNEVSLANATSGSGAPSTPHSLSSDRSGSAACSGCYRCRIESRWVCNQREGRLSLTRRPTIPCSSQNPKILGQDDARIIRYIIIIDGPFSRHLFTQKGQDCRFELSERHMASIAGDVLVLRVQLARGLRCSMPNRCSSATRPDRLSSLPRS